MATKLIPGRLRLACGSHRGIDIIITGLSNAGQNLTRRGVDCLEDLTRCLAEFADQVGGRRAERYRLMLEDVANAIELLRKRAGELQSLLSGTSAINP